MNVVELRDFLKQYCKPSMQTIMQYDRCLIRKPAKFENLSLNMDTYNTIMDAVHSVPGLEHIHRTKSGSIKKSCHYNICAYDVQEIGSRGILRGLTLTVILGSSVFMMKFGAQTCSVDSNMTGKRALTLFEKAAKHVGVDMTKYQQTFLEGYFYADKLKRVENKPMIWVDQRYVGKTIVASHLDMHKSYMSFLCKRHPEFFDVVNYIIKKHGLKKAKAIFVCTIGMMHSKFAQYKYAKLAVDAIHDNNAYLRHVMSDAKSQKFDIVLANTDGLVLYDKTKKNRLYHNAEEGPNMCQWSYDYTNTMFRADSARRYMYVGDDGKLNIKWSGVSRYEQIKTRDKWTINDYVKALSYVDDIIKYDRDTERLYRE